MRRERRINGPILLMVISSLTWAVAFGILSARAARHLFRSEASEEHVHTADCWDR